MSGDLGEMLGADERAHISPPPHCGAHAQGPRRPHESGDEPVPYGLVDVDALDGDAQLAGVGEAGADSAPHRAGHGGVGPYDERVLPAELGRDGDETGSRPGGHRRAGG